jgi:hypothetical protein
LITSKVHEGYQQSSECSSTSSRVIHAY